MNNNLNNIFSLPSKLELLDLSYWGVNNHTVYVKRDDQIHAIVSGNKWRKLKYNLQHYFSGSYNGIVTFGGAYSNHILATSYVADKCSIPLSLIIRGDRPKVLSSTLKACKKLGANLHFVSREDYRKKEHQRIFFKEQYPNFFLIPEGGANRFGREGCGRI